MASGLIPLIIVSSLFGVYLALSPLSNTSNVVIQSSCQQYSCVHVSINSNSPITGMTVSLAPAPAQCAYTRGCDPTSPECNLPHNFCSTINMESSADALTYQGVKQGFYWLEFSANVGENATRGTAMGIFVENQMTYYVTANITAGLATAKLSLTSTTTS